MQKVSKCCFHVHKKIAPAYSTLPFLGLLPNPSPPTSQFLCPCMIFSSFFPASVLCRLYIPGEASGAESIISMLHATTTQ